MTIPYPQALAAIRGGSAAQLAWAFNGLTIDEMVELGTFIGPRRLSLVAALTVYAIPVTSEGGETCSILFEINHQAFNVTPPTIADRVSQRLSQRIRIAILSVARRRMISPLLTVSSDVTGTLPAPTTVPAPLSDADYAAAATRQSVEIAAIKAVAIVESGGLRGFDSQGQPKILFEAHHFGPLTGNIFNRTHPHLSQPINGWNRARSYYGWNQYQRLREAMVLDIDAALKSASWGKFQVLGENHSGWSDVRSFVSAMYDSETNHLRSFEAYCNDRGLMSAVRSRNWLRFAIGYNGKQQRGYDRLIAQAYATASRAQPVR